MDIITNNIYFKPILINGCVRWVITDKALLDGLDVVKNNKLQWDKDDLLIVSYVGKINKKDLFPKTKDLKMNK